MGRSTVSLSATTVGPRANAHWSLPSENFLRSVSRERWGRLMRINGHSRREGVNDVLRNGSDSPAANTVDGSSTGITGPPLVPLDERPPTSLELLRQLEDIVRELFEISART
jgi:hypothetical protein